MKVVARIRLFFIQLKIVFGGGLAKPETWREKQALEQILERE